MKIIAFILLNFIIVSGFAQSPEQVVKKLGPNPAFFIDSVRVSQRDLQKYDPNQVAMVSVFYNKEAIDILGKEGKDGIVYVETIPFVKRRYWKFFSSKSKDYADLLPNFDSDSTSQYILNQRVLSGKGFEGTLASIDDKVFKEIRILDRGALQKEYGITDKLYGILIISDVPKELYKGKEKF